MTTEPGNSPAARDVLDTPEAGPLAIRGGALKLGGYGAGIAVTTVSAAVLFRHLGVDDAGRFVTVMSLVTIAAGLVEFGLTSIGVREYTVRPAAERGPLMRDLIGLRLVLSAIGLAGVVAFAAIVDYPSEMVIGALLAGAGTFAAAAQSTIAIPLMAHLRVGWLTVLEFMRQFTVALTIIAFAIAGGGLVAMLATPIPAGLLVVAMTIPLVRRSVPLLPRFHVDAWRALLRDILPYAAATAAATLYFRVAMIVMSLVSSPRETGYLGASFRVTEVLLLVPSLIVSTAFPIFARTAATNTARLAYGSGKLVDACVVLGGAVALALVTGADFVIDVIAGPKFGPSADVLRLQAAALFVTFVGTTFFWVLLSIRRHAVLLTLTLGALVVNVVLVALLGEAHGAQGAAVGLLVGELALVCGGFVALGRVDRTLQPSLAVFPRIAPGLVLGGAVALVPGLPSAVAMVLASAIYGLAALATRAVPEELLVEARKIPALARLIPGRL